MEAAKCGARKMKVKSINIKTNGEVPTVLLEVEFMIGCFCFS